MITFFVLLVAAVLIGLFAELNLTRVIGISIVAAMAVLVGGYLDLAGHCDERTPGS